MHKITVNEIKFWVGYEKLEDKLHCALNILTQLANGEYSAVTMREEIEGYFKGGSGNN